MEKVEQKEHIDNTKLVSDFRARGGRLFHVRPFPPKNWSNIDRGMTVAYIQKGSRIELATALQHKNDSFCKKNGTKVAIDHFNEGKTVFVPAVSKNPVAVFWQLKTAFQNWSRAV